MLPESLLRSEGELVGRETHTLVSLWDLYAAWWRAAAGALVLTRGGEAIPAGPQIHGQSPSPPALKNTIADGAAVAAPGQWREGWDVTFLRPSQVHVIEARRGEMVWVGSGMERGAGELGVMEGLGHMGRWALRAEGACPPEQSTLWAGRACALQSWLES